MSRALHRMIAWMLPLTLAVGAGCVGSPTTTSIRRTPRPTAIKSPSPATDGTSSLKFPSPRVSASTALFSPTPVPSPRPSVKPSPVASVPAVMAQPVAINPDADGFAPGTHNYLVVTAATASPNASYQMALGTASDTASAYHTLAAEAPHAGAIDRHAAFRAFEREALAGVTPPKGGYRVQAATTLTEGAERNFYVITSFDQSSYKDKQITARLAKVGAHCYVFVDKDVSKVAADAALMAKRVVEIANTFDTKIYPTDTRLFGTEPNPGVDGDAHVVLLLSPAVGNYGADTTLGYFSQRDEFLPSVSTQPIFQHSNAKEMLYISSRIVLTGSEEDYMGTVAHEFQHMINFNQKVLLGGNRQSDDLWIDEGMAMYAIEANGYGLRTGGKVLTDHVKRYQQEPQAFSLTDWAGNPDGIGYGPVYLFMVYLADRFSESIIKNIVTSKTIGIANIESQLKLRNTDFRHVFHDWAMANLLDGRTSGMSQLFQYQSLKMTGLSGKTRLDGVAASSLKLPGSSTWKLRPYTAQYYELPTGAIAPTFSFTPTTATGVQPRLVLP